MTAHDSRCSAWGQSNNVSALGRTRICSESITVYRLNFSEFLSFVDGSNQVMHAKPLEQYLRWYLAQRFNASRKSWKPLSIDHAQYHVGCVREGSSVPFGMAFSHWCLSHVSWVCLPALRPTFKLLVSNPIQFDLPLLQSFVLDEYYVRISCTND